MTLLNDFIGVRGMSGSSRGARLIGDALAHLDVQSISPRSEPSSRFARLMNMIWWDFVHVPVIAARGRRKILIHATNTGGRLPTQRSIVVMHDTMVLDHKNLFSRVFRLYAKTTFGLSARLADVVVTPSAHSASRITSRWPDVDVRVIPWPAPTPVSAPIPLTGRAGLLMVSSADRHKRIPMSIAIAARLRSDLELPLTLDLVLRPGNDTAEIEKAILEKDPRSEWIRVHENISTEELTGLYRSSYSLIVSSVDEGYCLPAIEAAAAGLPVVHSGRGSLSEVTTHTVSPADDLRLDEDAIYLQLRELIQDTERWQAAVRKGLDLAADRSPDKFRRSWESLVQEFS